MTRSLVLGLGSNEGDCRAHLSWALQCLEDRFGTLEVAPLYRSWPISSIPQDDFLNTVAVADASFSESTGLDSQLFAILSQLKGWERLAGRHKGPRFGPRVLDIDVLLCGDLECQIDGPGGEPAATDGLILPHPRLLERRFVLAPLADVLPDLCLPGSQITVAQRLVEIGQEQGVERVSWDRPRQSTARRSGAVDVGLKV